MAAAVLGHRLPAVIKTENLVDREVVRHIKVVLALATLHPQRRAKEAVAALGGQLALGLVVEVVAQAQLGRLGLEILAVMVVPVLRRLLAVHLLLMLAGAVEPQTLLVEPAVLEAVVMGIEQGGLRFLEAPEQLTRVVVRAVAEQQQEIHTQAAQA